MPEHAETRYEWEAMIADAIKRLNATYRDRVRAMLLRRAPMSEIEAAIKEYTKKTEDEIAVALLLIYFAANQTLTAEIGQSRRLGFTSDDIRGDAATWARRRAADFAQGWGDASAVAIGELDARSRRQSGDQAPGSNGADGSPGNGSGGTGGESGTADLEDDIEDELDSVFGDERAERAGTTETTGGISAGERGAQNRLARDGMEVIAIWQTERDGRVCKVCGELDGLPEDEYSDKFPEGPPAHPRCRCWLSFELIDKDDETGEE